MANYDSGCQTNCTTHYESNTSKAVPDGKQRTTSINVDRTGDAGVMTISVNITTNNQSHLLVRLKAPDNTKYTMHNQTGSGQNLVATFTVDATGENATGTWRLLVKDKVVDGTGANINNWAIDF